MSMTSPSWATVHELELLQKTLHESITALGSAVASVKTPVSPQLARGVQATENAWRAMEAEFGFETGHQIADREGSPAGTSLARERRRQGKLLGIRRRNAIVYPGFQFDGRGKVHPAVIDILAAARQLSIDDESLAQWFCSPSATLDGLRPVDRMDDGALVFDAFEAGFGVEW